MPRIGGAAAPILRERTVPGGGTDRETIRANQEAVKRAAENLGRVLVAGKLATKPGMNEAVIRVRKTLKELLSRPGSGNIYQIGTSPTKTDRGAGRDYRSHRASAPGQPPASLTGRLRQSYQGWVTEEGGHITGWVGTNVNYAPGLEFGTRRVRPRPHLRVAIAMTASQIGRILADAIAKGEQATVKQLREARR